MRPSFSQLWLNYPTENHPCDGPWGNQCAIRMSIALIASGLDLNTYTEPMCAHGHARGAESLANYLYRRIARPRMMTGTEFNQVVAQKTGIVFFKNIVGFRGGEGDHIDLWNKDRTKTGEYASSSSQTWFWELA
jgi:hypothetical protein